MLHKQSCYYSVNFYFGTPSTHEELGVVIVNEHVTVVLSNIKSRNRISK